MQLKRIVLSFMIILYLLPTIVFSWNAVGHKVIATIAYEKLNPNVREKIDEVVGVMSSQYQNTNSFPQLSVWPDRIRLQKIETYTHWHYINKPIFADKVEFAGKIDTDNAIWAVNKIVPIIKNKKANRYEFSRFIAFYSHIVSDLHQPLHTVSYFSKAFPRGDRGGNGYQIIYDQKKDNLHHLWDSGIGIFNVEDNNENITLIANQLTAKYPEASFQDKLNNLNPNDWVEEGVLNAKKYVYQTPLNEAVSQSYIETNKSIAEQQAALAGYRLAMLLNQLLG